MKKTKRIMEEYYDERCELCNRYKFYNTGGGFICTNMNCKDGITIEQDFLEVDIQRCKETPEYFEQLKPIMPKYYLKEIALKAKINFT